MKFQNLKIISGNKTEIKPLIILLLIEIILIFGIAINVEAWSTKGFSGFAAVKPLEANAMIRAVSAYIVTTTTTTTTTSTSTSTTTIPAKTMSGFTALKPMDWTLGAGNCNDNILLVNGEGVRVTLMKINITGDCSSEVTTNVDGKTIEAGDILKIPTVDANLCGTAGDLGSPYRVVLTIFYNKTLGEVTQQHQSVGTLRGTWECVFPTTTSTTTTTTTTTIPSSVSITRILPSIAQPNSNLTVSLNLVILNESTKPNSAIIKEYIPLGWNFTSSNPNKDDFNPENGEIRWFLYSDKFYTRNLIYTLSVPRNATGKADFFGVVLSTFEDNQVTLNISGINTIQIGYKADKDNDGKISDFELLDYINLWVKGLVDDFSLLVTVDEWAMKGGTVSKTMTGFTALKPLDWTITSAANGDSLVLINGEGTTVGINSITFTAKSGETCIAGANALAINIAAGDSATTGPLANSCSGTSGAAYKIEVSIGYNRTIGTVTQLHTSVGTLRGVFE